MHGRPCEVPVKIPSLLYSVLPCLMITTTGSAPSFTAARGRVTLLPGDGTKEKKGKKQAGRQTIRHGRTGEWINKWDE